MREACAACGRAVAAAPLPETPVLLAADLTGPDLGRLVLWLVRPPRLRTAPPAGWAPPATACTGDLGLRHEHNLGYGDALLLLHHDPAGGGRLPSMYLAATRLRRSARRSSMTSITAAVDRRRSEPAQGCCSRTCACRWWRRWPICATRNWDAWDHAPEQVVSNDAEHDRRHTLTGRRRAAVGTREAQCPRTESPGIVGAELADEDLVEVTALDGGPRLPPPRAVAGASGPGGLARCSIGQARLLVRSDCRRAFLRTIENEAAAAAVVIPLPSTRRRRTR